MNRHSRHINFVWMSLLLASVFSAGQVAAQSGASDPNSERFERAVRLIEQATHARSDGEHLRLLRGLRQLHDEDLQPFFTTLFQSSNPVIKVHAFLGSAAISESQTIDPWKLSQFDQVELQRGALGEAIADGLVGIDELREILKRPELDESIKSVVLVMLVSQGDDVDPGEFEKLMDESGSPIVKARCALMLLHMGKDDGCHEALTSLNDLPRSIREEAVANLLGLLQKERLSGSTWWLQELYLRDDLSILTRLDVVRTMILLDPDTGRAWWKETYLSNDGIAHKLRAGLMLLTLAHKAQPGDFAILESESFSLLKAIGQAGSVVASGSPAVDECLNLIAFHHPLSSAWVLEHADRIKESSEDASNTILAALVRDSLTDGESLQERLELAMIASRILTPMNPDMLAQILRETDARQSRLAQEAILAGTWLARSPDALKVIVNFDSWLSTRAGSLAVLIKARYADQLTEDDLTRLSLIFGGAGRVGSEYQVQAAWLYLKHTGQEGPALASVLSQITEGRPPISDNR